VCLCVEVYDLKPHILDHSQAVISMVLNRMQGTHYMEAGPSSSRVEEVVEPPKAPIPATTIVGGPSQAPIQSAAPVSIASYKPLGITYSKAVTLPMQSVSGLSSSKDPFNMEKECMLLKTIGIKPTAEPICAMYKLVSERDEMVNKVLGKHCQFMEFSTNSSPVQNAVASTLMPEKPVKPLLQDSLFPVPAFKTMKEYDEHEKKHCNRTKKAKSAKKDLHPAPFAGIETTNV
jgi:hypothetical protein